MDRGRRRSQGPDPEEDLYQDEYEEYEVARPRRRSAQQARPHPQPRPRPRPRPPERRRGPLPVLLMGCGIGVLVTVLAAAVVVFLALRQLPGSGVSGLPVIGGLQMFSREETIQVPLTALSQIQVCDKIGNVSIQADPNATTTKVVAKKIVHVSNQTEAEQEFKRITVEVQPPGTIANPITCAKADTEQTPTPTTSATQGNALTVNVTMPTDSGLIQNSKDAVDLQITLPPNVLPSDGPTLQLNVEAPVGNIAVNGLSGILNIRGSTGNVTVERAVLAGGSHIDTGQGNVIFNGLFQTNSPDPANPARYYLRSEQGNVDVSLPANTNLILDINTNSGKVASEFPITPQTSDGSITYRGPLNPTANPAPTAVLFLDVSIGNVNIHKLQASQ